MLLFLVLELLLLLVFTSYFFPPCYRLFVILLSLFEFKLDMLLFLSLSSIKTWSNLETASKNFYLSLFWFRVLLGILQSYLVLYLLTIYLYSAMISLSPLPNSASIL
jgi:hypothetical protein